MTEKEYASYLLRLWKAEYQRRSVWRASLEDVRTRERVYLDMDRLLNFLRDRFGEAEPDEKPIGREGGEEKW